MSEKNSDDAASIQFAFRYIYLLAIKGLSLRLGVPTQLATVLMALKAQDASDFYGIERTDIAHDLTLLAGNERTTKSQIILQYLSGGIDVLNMRPKVKTN